MLKRIRKSAVRSEMCKDRALAQVWIESKAIKCKERATCSCVGAGEPHHSTSESVRLYYTGSIVIVSILSLFHMHFLDLYFAAGWWSRCAFAKRLSLSLYSSERGAASSLLALALFNGGNHHQVGSRRREGRRRRFSTPCMAPALRGLTFCTYCTAQTQVRAPHGLSY
jgi:hypothetical protein